jgi:DNA-binding response OmpR family regulator
VAAAADRRHGALGMTAVAEMRARRPGLVLLDMMLPDGLEG